jgi:hypothetical protein
MNSNITIACNLSPTDPSVALGFEAWVDDLKFFDSEHVQTAQQLSVEIADTDNKEHELKFVMKNKTSDHTKIDEHSNIISDARLIITDLTFDEIQLGHMVTEQATYTHNFNGTGQQTQEKFYGEIGCNGIVSLRFSTPMYLWLLEHM